MALFEGDADQIVTAAGLTNVACSKVTKEQAEKLLRVAQAKTRPVDPALLGALGQDAFTHYDKLSHQATPAYARMFGNAKIGSTNIPFVVEAWARRAGDTDLAIFINRTPVTGDHHAARDKRDIDAFGCGLSHTIAKGPKDEHFDIQLSIITPYVPITSDGKEPSLTPFLRVIQSAIDKLILRDHRWRRLAREKWGGRTSALRSCRCRAFPLGRERKPVWPKTWWSHRKAMSDQMRSQPLCRLDTAPAWR